MCECECNVQYDQVDSCFGFHQVASAAVRPNHSRIGVHCIDCHTYHTSESKSAAETLSTRCGAACLFFSWLSHRTQPVV